MSVRVQTNLRAEMKRRLSDAKGVQIVPSLELKFKGVILFTTSLLWVKVKCRKAKIKMISNFLGMRILVVPRVSIPYATRYQTGN